MHRIQEYVIHQLMMNPSLRYARIKPLDVEGNLFMYHLKKLIHNGLVEKQDSEYSLTPAGALYVDKLSLKTFQPRIQPKIVTMIACQNNKGEWLVYRRRKQPFLGLVGFPYGKIHLGEKIHHAALRELKEKTGLVAKLTHRGEVYSTVFRGSGLMSQMLIHVFSGRSPKGELIIKSDIGECFWQKVDDLQSPGYMPAFAAILRLLQKTRKERFFAELVYHT